MFRDRSQNLQVNTRWKALAEIYTMHSFAPFFKLKISAKNGQHFFAIELMNFRFFIFLVEFCFFFCEFFMNFFPPHRAEFQKRVTSVAFQSILRKRIRKLPKFLKILKIIQFYSILFNFIQSCPYSQVLAELPAAARADLLADLERFGAEWEVQVDLYVWFNSEPGRVLSNCLTQIKLNSN